MRTSIALAASALALAACSTGSGTAADTTDASGPAERTMRIFDADGVEVVTVTETTELPEQASVVEFAGMVIDSGDGPVICTGVVAESDPPQCAGVAADGLEMDWAQRSGDVTWGNRKVTVRWPPEDNRTEVLDHGPADGEVPPDPTTALPEECAEIDQFPTSDQVYRYMATLGETNGGVFVADNGELVLQVTDDPTPHRTALSTGDVEGCVIQVAHSEAELFVVQEEIPLDMARSSWVGPVGRVTVTVPVADAYTVRQIALLIDDPTTLRVIGEAVILEG